MSLVIIGCGLGPGDLTEKMRCRIAEAGILAGGRRLLDWFPAVRAEKVELGAAARQVAAELLVRAESGKVVVLASGDPLFFGIAGTFSSLRKEMEQKSRVEIEVWPNISSIQAACARLGRDWSGLAFFNLHGREAELPWRAILRAPGGAILLAGAGEQAAQKLAAGLIEAFPRAAGRRAAVLADLGRPDREQVFSADLAAIAESEFSPLALLYLEPPAAEALLPPLALGLETGLFVHEAGLITKPEVRALALARLGLVPGVLWDLGAGSGSVAVEAALLQPGLKVCAVEKEENRCRMIAENAARFGCTAAISIHQRKILDILPELPAPDRVFIGGGGEDIAEIAAAAFARLRPGGRLVAAAVTLESRAALTGSGNLPPGEIIEINISRSRPLNGLRLLKSENPIALYLFHKPLDGECS